MELVFLFYISNETEQYVQEKIIYKSLQVQLKTTLSIF